MDRLHSNYAVSDLPYQIFSVLTKPFRCKSVRASNASIKVEPLKQTWNDKAVPVAMETQSKRLRHFLPMAHRIC